MRRMTRHEQLKIETKILTCLKASAEQGCDSHTANYLTQPCRTERAARRFFIVIDDLERRGVIETNGTLNGTTLYRIRDRKP